MPSFYSDGRVLTDAGRESLVRAALLNLPRALEATLDWASNPCTRCGKYPLHVSNRTGYCRECSRRHVRMYGRRR